jgi:uncharacterized protein involved in exopolysaccharide biosynthesis
MIPRKLVEAVFRWWWLIVIPVIAVPTALVVMTTKTPEFLSYANVWVTRPNGIDGGALLRDGSPYLTPAQLQAQVFADLMATKSFRDAVAVKANLNPETGGEVVALSTSVRPAGNHLLSISARHQSAEVSRDIVEAVVSVYRERSLEASRREVAIAITYYSGQLNAATEELEKRRSELSAYVAANPRAPESRNDLTYARLANVVGTQTVLVDSLVDSLQAAQLSEVTVETSADAVFSIQDPAALSAEPLGIPLSKRVGYPFAGLVFGMLISASFVYLVYRSDHSIRSAQDLEGLAVPLLTYIPEINGASGFARGLSPVVWLARMRRRNYARNVAASISVQPAPEAIGR